MDTAVLPARHRLDVDDYYRMAEAGILAEGARVELIDGEVIDMAPIGQGHASIMAALNERLVLVCAGRAFIWPQNTVRLDRLNEPQPDLAVLRRRPDFYAAGERPGPADVMLLVELADSSLHYDRTVKLPLYARSGIPELWLVDLKRRALDAYRRPEGDGYAEMTTHQPGDTIALAAAAEIVITLDLVFGSTTAR